MKTKSNLFRDVSWKLMGHLLQIWWGRLGNFRARILLIICRSWIDQLLGIRMKIKKCWSKPSKNSTIQSSTEKVLSKSIVLSMLIMMVNISPYKSNFSRLCLPQRPQKKDPKHELAIKTRNWSFDRIRRRRQKRIPRFLGLFQDIEA